MGLKKQSTLQKSKSSSENASLKSVMIAVASAQFLLPFMMTGASPLLPAIGQTLSASAMQLSLINALYALSLSIVYLIAGQVGDILGRRKVFLTGLAIFTIVSAISPFAPTIEIFLGLRLVQATGTAMMNTSALAILTVCAPPAILGQVLGIASMGMYAGLCLGPGLSSLIATMSDWRYIFWGVAPVGVLAWCLMKFMVHGDWRENAEEPFDWKGALSFAPAIAALSAGLMWILNGSWAIGLVIAGIFLLAYFLYSESHCGHPILDVHFLMRHKFFALSVLASLINYSSTFGSIFYFSLFLQGVQGMTLLHAGMMLSIQTALQLFTAPLSGRLSDKYGAGKISTLGMGICGTGLLISVFLDASSSLVQVVMAQIILGAGVGFFASSNTSAIMGSVDSAHLGQASGLVGTMRTMGNLFSMVIISVSMNFFLGDEPLHAENIDAFLQAMHSNFILFGILNLIGISFAFVRSRTSSGD